MKELTIINDQLVVNPLPAGPQLPDILYYVGQCDLGLLVRAMIIEEAAVVSDELDLIELSKLLYMASVISDFPEVVDKEQPTQGLSKKYSKNI